ncbi:MAG TPA: arsenic resistance protein [Burkholderiaceae bacterium]|nr:arsenic resistance protein [Burkholderiaceae bacterium]
MNNLRACLERHQIPIYAASICFAIVAALLTGNTDFLEGVINPALALMLFVTFSQVPLSELGRSFARVRFLGALMVSNFALVPMLVALLIQFLPADPVIRLGVLFVLLTPCIDYVVTFSHIGRADARLLLACTPLLLVAQILLLPLYLRLFLGGSAIDLVQLGPFVHAFLWLIVVPLVLATLLQCWSRGSDTGQRIATGLGVLPVPATALVLFLVMAAMVPKLAPAIQAAWRVLPIYLGFAVVAPFMGWAVARLARLEIPACRAVAFSSATRNSLVMLPLALAVPGSSPILPAIIVTQTMVELVASVVYMRLMPRLGRA